MFHNKLKKYANSLKLSKQDKEKIDKKLDKLKLKKCLICGSKKIYMDEMPLIIKTEKNFTKYVYHRKRVVCHCCENCGHSQFFDLRYLI